MKAGSCALLAWIFLALTLGQKAQGEQVAPQEVQSNLNALSKVQTFQQADDPRPCPSENSKVDQAPAAPFTMESFAKAQSCSEALSTVPPSWISSASNAGIFTDPDNWLSICSAYKLEQLARERNSGDRILALAQLESETLKLDTCTVSSHDSYSTSFQHPSQETYQVQPMSLEGRKKLVAQFEGEKSKLADSCCGPDVTCRTLIQSVSLKFCKPQRNPKAPDPCVVNGTYFRMGRIDEKLQWIARVKKGVKTARIKGHYSVAGGELTMSPLEDVHTHQPYFGGTIFAIRHELGHACSHIQRDLLINQGNQEAISDLRRFDDCTLDSNRSSLYRHLHDTLGINQETSHCIEIRAQAAKNARFTKVAGCKDGCSRAYLEESFANVVAITQTAPSDIASRLLPDLCTFYKDSHHGLSADDLRCALSTPSLRAKIEEGLACKK